MKNKIIYLLLMVIGYIAHVIIVTGFLGGENVIGNYAFSFLTLAISARAQGYLCGICYMYNKSSRRTAPFLVVERILLPCFPIYLFGIPFLGWNVVSTVVLATCAASIFLFQFVIRDLEEYFWSIRGGVLAKLPDSGEASVLDTNKILIQFYFLVLVLPLLGVVVGSFYQ
ncbi:MULTISPECIES: hypothetical protein [unclassified Oleiphilus]|uniref:hypothetical protein n=2 Tax=Oleiphilus TaxID=141450 RepID=UPI0007C3D888|nr:MULTISPECIES: hypothetical protein [unclassified Oleiphilus]KZY43928.1 hypothetical protein A3732_13355 [Oleiphilus sp. HI0050]KZZ34262.1 hypothetical protein A3756_03400 [Oleiphilus sp. HI0086]KZZ53833.1 hypothetical protein A3761_15955 [Oleiphilus sp. HI0123]